VKLNLQSKAREEGRWLYLAYEENELIVATEAEYKEASAEDKVAFKLLPMGPKYDAMIDELRKPKLKKMRKGNISVADEKAFRNQAIARLLVVGVDNLSDAEGKVGPDDERKLFAVFQNYQDIATEVSAFCENARNFDDEAVEAQAGKSPSGSASMSSSESTQSL